MSFTYYSGVPASGNDPSDDQPLMLTNSQSIDGILNVDHFSFGAQGPADGRHKQVSMRNQSSPALPNTFDGVFYCNNDFPLWKNAASASSGTDYNVATYVGTPLAAANGYTYLPGGLIFQWGLISSATKNAVTTVSFNTNFPTACYSITGSLGLGTSGAALTLIPGTGPAPITNFTYYLNTNSGQTLNIYWFAVGI